MYPRPPRSIRGDRESDALTPRPRRRRASSAARRRRRAQRERLGYRCARGGRPAGPRARDAVEGGTRVSPPRRGRRLPEAPAAASLLRSGRRRSDLQAPNHATTVLRSTRFASWRWGANRAAHRRPSAPPCNRPSSPRRRSCSARASRTPTSTSSASPRGPGSRRTAFYFYFRDKRELLLRLTEDVTDELYTPGRHLVLRRGRAHRRGRARRCRRSAPCTASTAPVLRAIVQAAATTTTRSRSFWHAIL